jgi:pullulanase/glycogen debranching enzyme
MFSLSLFVGLAQDFTEADRTQGYKLNDDTVTFVFDERIYEVNPSRVFVTGAFRGWDAGTTDVKWDLKKQEKLWVLVLDNSDDLINNSNALFKFRIDDGQWMDPPQTAKNTKGGNLVITEYDEIKKLKAEFRHETLIWAEVPAPRPLVASGYRLTNAKGEEIRIVGVLPNESLSTLLVPERPLDIKRVHYLEIPSLNQKIQISFDGWFRELFSTKTLGANIKDGATTFRLFAPRAEMVKLFLYKNRSGDQAYRVVDLSRDADGVWEFSVDEDLHGIYYDYTVHGASDPGNFFYETNPVQLNDPYARVSDDTWGRARVWRSTAPAPALKNGIPKMEDVIAYEMHVQDFTDNLPVDEKYKGTIKAITIPGLRNARGEKIGFDYLLDLGINVVHLMPVQEYLHFPTDDWQDSFIDDPYMIEQGVNEENYQWGYRTTFAMAVESRYRTKGTEPGTEREEFRDLVRAFHENDIAVIIDIVPNHTGENMDGNEFYFNFNGIDKQYYYRTKDLEHIGAYGNEVKTENRPMVQRWLIDQCRHFIEEFGIDGFRIDLAGQIDQQTLLALRAALGDDIIIYGEAWIGSNDPDYEANPDWDWYKSDSPITFFQDDSRNAFKGPVFELNSKKRDRGWPGGKFNERKNVMKGLANRFPDDKTPLSGISYLDIHDNFALADQFGSENFDGRLSVDQNEYKLAATLLYTTLGPIVTHGGSEIMRSKAHAPLREVVKETKAGYKIYMHGYRDTYNHRKANQFLWETVGQTPTGANKNDYANMYAFWKGLNEFRRSEYGSVFRIAEHPDEGYYDWILPSKRSALGYIVDKKVLVLLNAGSEPQEFEFELPEGEWKIIGNTREVDINGVKDLKSVSALNGGKQTIKMEPVSLRIWVRTN